MEETERSQVMEHTIDEFIVSYNLDKHRNLLNLVDQQIKKDELALTQELEKDTSHIEADLRDDYYEHLLAQRSDLEEYMRIFLDAFFASSFALFEYELVQVCEWARKAVKTPFSEKHFGPSASMSDVKDYLKKLGVDFPAGSSEWQQATNYREIRNKIMHAGSALGENVDENDNIFRFAKENGILVEASSFEGNKEFTLQLTREFCEKALDDMKQVLIQVNVAEEKWSQGEHLRGQ